MLLLCACKSCAGCVAPTTRSTSPIARTEQPAHLQVVVLLLQLLPLGLCWCRRLCHGRCQHRPAGTETHITGSISLCCDACPFLAEHTGKSVQERRTMAAATSRTWLAPPPPAVPPMLPDWQRRPPLLLLLPPRPPAWSAMFSSKGWEGEGGGKTGEAPTAVQQ